MSLVGKKPGWPGGRRDPKGDARNSIQSRATPDRFEQRRDQQRSNLATGRFPTNKGEAPPCPWPRYPLRLELPYRRDLRPYRGTARTAEYGRAITVNAARAGEHELVRGRAGSCRNGPLPSSTLQVRERWHDDGQDPASSLIRKPGRASFVPAVTSTRVPGATLEAAATDATRPLAHVTARSGRRASPGPDGLRHHAGSSPMVSRAARPGNRRSRAAPRGVCCCDGRSRGARGDGRTELAVACRFDRAEQRIGHRADQRDPAGCGTRARLRRRARRVQRLSCARR